MPSAEKRRRQKENSARAREEREAADRRARMKRNAIRVGVVVLIAVAILVVINLTRDDGDESDTTSETTAATDTTSDSSSEPTEAERAAILTEAGCDPTVPDAGEKPTFDAPEQVLDDGTAYTATIETSCGTIVVELDNETAPDGANNFAFLAEQGFYDALTWHRVADDFVIQGGDPQGTGAGGPGYQVATELPSGYALGDLAWGKSQLDADGTAGSQFFVVTGERGTVLPPQYGRFGTVVEGLEVAQQLESFNQGDGPPSVDLYILSVTVEPVEQVE